MTDLRLENFPLTILVERLMPIPLVQLLWEIYPLYGEKRHPNKQLP